MNKSLATNLIALALIGLGAISPIYPDQILAVGLFAASGAFTNWLAVHMLFEKVPGFYGSGVVPGRFEEIKANIHKLVMNEFFTRGNVEGFFASQTNGDGRLLNPDSIVEAIDYDQVYAGLVEIVLSSRFGSILGLVGGTSVFEPLKAPFKDRMRAEVYNILTAPTFLRAVQSGLQQSHLSEDIIQKAGDIVARRLDEFTPEMVKKIVQDMIHKHLGWLVVWGGVFGGFIGLITSLI